MKRYGSGANPSKIRSLPHLMTSQSIKSTEMMEKNSKIYIAGHRGLVGSAILRKLREQGFSTIVTRTSSELDLRRQSDTERFFAQEQPDYVFLAAAKVGGILANNTYKAEFIYDNILIAANVIHAAYTHRVKKLLNLGSSCIYPKFAPQPLKEEYLMTGLLEPTNEPYAVAKISTIKLCRYYNEQYGTNFISVMPTNLFGLHDNFNLETAHVLPALIRKFHLARLFKEKKYGEIEKDAKRFPLGFNISDPSDMAKMGITPDYVQLWGTGQPYREFLFADDLADACVFIMKNCNAGSAPSFPDNQQSRLSIGEFINIGTGEDITIKALAELVRRIVGYEGEIVWDVSKPDGTPRKRLDVTKISSLGWQPRISLEQGIRITYDWYLSG
jgi:GDP-L-fucose synthase